jgi:outer membrane immunogenic protein
VEEWGRFVRYFAVALVTAISTAVLVQIGLAADLPAKAPVILPAAIPYNWTGFYLGIAGGGGRAETRHTNANNDLNSGDVSINGGLFGGTYGYNVQLGSWVLGIEGDFSWSGIRKDFDDSIPELFFCTIPDSPLKCVTNLRWLGTDRARIGYAWDRLLVYGTAGIAYGNVSGTLANADFFVSTGDSMRTGFIFGGGIEWAFTPAWSAKAEYLRTDFGSEITYNISNRFLEYVSLTKIDVARVGLNYHFR